MHRFTLVLIAVLTASCSGGSKTPPAPPATSTFNGTYTGSATGTQINLGPAPPPTSPSNFLLTAMVANGVITGSLRTPPGAEVQGSIPLSRTVTASGGVAFTATDQCGAQVYSIIGSIMIAASGSGAMAGTWSQPGHASCSRGASGTFTLARQ